MRKQENEGNFGGENGVKDGDDEILESFFLCLTFFFLSHRGTTDPDITSLHKVIKLTWWVCAGTLYVQFYICADANVYMCLYASVCVYVCVAATW